MSFNKNATKRLSIIAGINRESRDVTNIINHTVQEYLNTIIRQVLSVVLFAGRKTILVKDVRFLHRVCPNQIQIACPTNLEKLSKLCINTVDIKMVLGGTKSYALYTLKKPFSKYVRNIITELSELDIRVGKNVMTLLQTMTEQHIINIMNRAATYTIRDNRDTLLPLDIETALKVLG